MTRPRVQGLNHLTLAVSDLERSVAFYRDLLGFEIRALWGDGAYLEAGPLWLCLSVDPAAKGAVRADYTHYAFDVAPEDFDAFSDRVGQQATVWKDNSSEGASLYFLDPDGHRLELHVGSLASRLAHYRAVSRDGAFDF
jgi:catechol 2,3-dioxygenase-like lactoylglutathione lyase family enzyme